MVLKQISDEDFVKLWQTYEGSLKALGEELGAKVQSLTNKANYLRRHGVKLRNFPRRDVKRGKNENTAKHLEKLAKLANDLQ